DKLHWQYRIGKSLNTKINIPKVYEYFSNLNESYLIIRYIRNATTYKDTIKRELKGIFWADHNFKTKKKFLTHIKKILIQIEKMHEIGYVHRDITGTNFLVKSNGKVTL